jgi:signal transduction histidine kinase
VNFIGPMKEDKPDSGSSQLRDLTKQIRYILDEERKRIAREIHDDLGQSLTVVLMDLTLLVQKLEDRKQCKQEDVGELVKNLKEITKAIDNSIEAANNIIAELGPEVLGRLGLVKAIDKLANSVCTRLGIEVRISHDQKLIDLPEAVVIEVYRIVQEALTNIAKHANAKLVEINVNKLDYAYIFDISDDGVGIDAEAIKASNTFGLIGMNERASNIGAQLYISKLECGGTQVKLQIPLKENLL